ncbi:putative mitochondrial mRNA-processing protein [Clavispora lusitaniae]|uniref:Mitochondrial mRNA-processing protein n=1 Tax=Clavispora lusitaniae TaxID=36911 RepID=A0AA91T4A6_CLALS|nr:putative mitochondrial mRNA-processing protein [Clavispora lusitaniae]
MLRFGLIRSMQMLSSRALSTSLVAPSALLRSVSHSPLPISQTMARMQTLQFPLSQTFHREVQVPLVTNVAEDVSEDNTIYMDSVLRKRRLKMKKHKLRKRRRNQRALKKRLGKL